MSDMDDKLRSAYARLPREEPPASLDAAILAASRQALAPRRSVQRWAVPVSLAAVLVLAFGVALHRDEYPSSFDEAKLSAPPPAEAGRTLAPQSPPAKPVPQPKLAQAPAPQGAAESAPAAKSDVAPAVRAKKTANAAGFRDEREERRANAEAKPERKDLAFAPEPRDAVAPQATLQKETANAAPMAAAPMQAPAARTAPAAPPAPASIAAAPAPQEAQLSRAQPRMKAEASRQAPAGAAADSSVPGEITRELDAIAKLRAENRAEEADKALEAFRRKHPGYRIPDAVWERVKPR